MVNFTDAYIRTAGAYVSIHGLYPFQLGLKPHNGSYPVVRLGGHVEANETGWECAAREVAEEACISIRPISSKSTYLVSSEDPEITISEITWEFETRDAIQPILVLVKPSETKPGLSMMYLAQSDDMPKPSAEVKGILLLDPDSIFAISQGSITLDQYLKRGGKAIFNEDFDQNIALEPFIQLRILSKLLKAQRI